MTTEHTGRLPCRPCPVDDCEERFLSADAAGKHLDRAHDEDERWAGSRYMACDNVGPCGDSLVIADMADGQEEAWVQSDFTVEVSK